MSTQAPPQPHFEQQQPGAGLRGLFISGLEHRLQSLQSSAWTEIPSADMRREQLPFHVGMIVLTSANEEARRMQREQMRTNPTSTIDVLPRDHLLESFSELGATLRATPEPDRSQELRRQLEGLWLRPERFIDTQIVVTLGKLANSRQLGELSNLRSGQLTRIVPFALAVQGMVAAELPLPKIKPATTTPGIPSPRSSVRYVTTRDPRTGRTTVSSVQ